MRDKYFAEVNPDTVKKNLIKDLEGYVLAGKPKEFQSLVDSVYHPEGQHTSSAYGNNLMFRALTNICDQLFIYSEYLQELLKSHNSYSRTIRQDIKSIVPAFARGPDESDMEVKRSIHQELELQDKYLKRKRLEESPNKLSLFRLIDGKKTLSELWESFNLKNRGKNKDGWVSKQYISQIIKELEESDVILLERKGKAKIPTHIVDLVFPQKSEE